MKKPYQAADINFIKLSMCDVLGNSLDEGESMNFTPDWFAGKFEV